MVMDIITFLVFFLFFLSSPVNSDNLCPISYCPNNNLPIKYPFRLEGHQTPNCSYTDLKCTSQGAVILNLPEFGDFYVRDIHYGNDYPLILLYDPQNCLSKRIMGSNFLSFFPGDASDFQDYTFYSCPYDLVAWKKIPIIGCLSNASSAAVAVRVDLVERKRELRRCREIVTSSMPVSRRDPPDFIGDDRELVLEWFASNCESCPYKKREMVSSYLVDLAFVIVSFAAVLMPGVICIGCCISFGIMFRKELKMKRSNAATLTAHP